MSCQNWFFHSPFVSFTGNKCLFFGEPEHSCHFLLIFYIFYILFSAHSLVTTTFFAVLQLIKSMMCDMISLLCRTQKINVCMTHAKIKKKGPNNQECVENTKFTEFPLSQHSKLSSFIRRSGEFLSLFIFLLLLIAVSVAALTYSMMVLKFSDCLYVITVDRREESILHYRDDPVLITWTLSVPEC